MASGMCPVVLTKELFLHCLLTSALVIVQSSQGVLLDTFLIKAAPTSRAPYFWLLTDFFTMIGFVITLYVSFHHWKKQTGRTMRIKSASTQATARRNPSLFVKHRALLGYHPLCYITWFCYSVTLVAKTAFIFKSELLNHLDTNTYFGPQLLKFTLALTAVVFYLLVCAHNDAEPNSKQALYIDKLLKGTAFEVFDSITLLSLLIVPETHIMYSSVYENTVIAFACINLLLPVVCLYKLSLNDYGRETTNELLSFVYKMLHLFLVNIPYMIVRIYLWWNVGVDISVFLVKNITHICITLYDCKDEVFSLTRAAHHWWVERSAPKTTKSSTGGNVGPALEGSILGGGSLRGATLAEETFVDIDLRSSSDLRSNTDQSVPKE